MVNKALKEEAIENFTNDLLDCDEHLSTSVNKKVRIATRTMLPKLEGINIHFMASYPETSGIKISLFEFVSRHKTLYSTSCNNCK